MCYLTKPGDELCASDVYFSYLPLAHVMEQCFLSVAAFQGMQIAFYGGDITTIIQEDIPYARPTMFVSVPRLFNRIYDILKMKFDS